MLTKLVFCIGLLDVTLHKQLHSNMLAPLPFIEKKKMFSMFILLCQGVFLPRTALESKPPVVRLYFRPYRQSLGIELRNEFFHVFSMIISP